MSISSIFLRAGILALLVGILLGMWMGSMGAFEFIHAHAHTNLVGWASLMIVGMFYRLFPVAEAWLIAKVHMVLMLTGVVLMLGGMIATAAGGPYLMVQIAGELIVGISALLFAVIVFRATGKGAPQA